MVVITCKSKNGDDLIVSLGDDDYVGMHVLFYNRSDSLSNPSSGVSSGVKDKVKHQWCWLR